MEILSNSFIVNNFLGNNLLTNKIANEGIVNSNFVSSLKEDLDKLNQKQIKADEMTSMLALGEDVEIHEVMLAQQEAKMSLELAVQVRNKVVESVQELIKMQI